MLKSGIYSIFTIAMVTKMAAKIDQLGEIGEKQLSVFGSRGGQTCPLMHVTLYYIFFLTEK